MFKKRNTKFEKKNFSKKFLEGSLCFPYILSTKNPFFYRKIKHESTLIMFNKKKNTNFCKKN